MTDSTPLSSGEDLKKRKKSVFHFLDYRQYLQELFSQMQEQDSGFSYRAFARLAESSSPNFLQLILSGKLRISDRQADALARNSSFREKEYEYFRALIDFDHSDTHAGKNEAFRRIIALRETRIVNHLAEYQYSYLADWYNPVVRELVCSPLFNGDLQEAADRLIPPVGLREIKKSVQMMEELGLISKSSEKPGWDYSETTVATPDEVFSLAVVEYHRQMLLRAAQSLELFTGEQRDIRAVTMGIPKSKLPLLKERMTDFWKEILELSQSDDTTEIVVQINTQLFPLTKID